MANLTETDLYDVGVYQIETTDPVQGGATGLANKPLINLANRTGYLKNHVDALEAAAAGNAPINSPTFTGTPAAPTPPAGDADTSIATTAFAANLMGGVQSVSVAGSSNVTLNATQYGAGVIKLTGALTGNINVIFPVTGKWVVQNATTGGFTITLKTAAGTGTLVTQGKTLPIHGDGTNIMVQRTDFNSLASVSIAGSGTFTGADAATWTSSGILGLTHLAIGTGAMHGTELLRVNGDVWFDFGLTTQGNITCANGSISSGNNLSCTGFNQVCTFAGLNWVITNPVSGTVSLDIVPRINGVRLSDGASSFTSISALETKTDLEPIPGANPAHAAALVAARGKQASRDNLADCPFKIINAHRAVIGRYKNMPENARRPFLIWEDAMEHFPHAAVHELERTEIVHAYKDGKYVYDADGKPVMEEYTHPEFKGINYDHYVPLMMAALQKQHAINEALEARVAALESIVNKLVEARSAL